MRTLSDLAEQYLREHSQPKGTYKSDAQNLKQPVKHFGWIPTEEAHKLTAQFYQRHGVGAATLRREVVALQAVINWGAERGLVQARVKLCKPVANSEPRDKWLDEEQEREVRDALPGAGLSVYLFGLLALTYGVRKGAIMDLVIGSQVDWRANTIDFNKPGAAKLRKRRPVVPMTEEVRTLMLERTKQGYLRAVDRNTPYQFQKLMRSIGYDWVTPHVLKHSAITLMLRGGARIEDVAALTATDMRTMLATYRHHTVEELLAVAERRRA